MRLSLEKVQQLAQQYDHVQIMYDERQQMVSFMGFMVCFCRVNVYLSTATVATCLDHPVKGKTQLFRRHVTMKQLREIFKNPRVHTGKGYY